MCGPQPTFSTSTFDLNLRLLGPPLLIETSADLCVASTLPLNRDAV